MSLVRDLNREKPYLQLNGQHIRQFFDAGMPLGLLRSLAIVAPVLAFVRLDILLLEAFLESQRCLLTRFLAPFLCQIFEADTQVKKGLHLMCLTIAILASCCGLELTVVRLMYDAIATMLTATLRPFAVTIALVQLLGQKLEELVGVLLFCGDQVVERLVF